MASFNLIGPPAFPEGTSVAAYPLTNWAGATYSGAAPVGSSTETKTVTSGVAAFTALAADTRYVAYAQVDTQHRYVRFSTLTDPTTTGGSGVPDGGTTGQTLVKNSSTDGDATWGSLPIYAKTLVPAATRNGQGASVSNGTDTGEVSRTKHRALFATSELYVVYTNWSGSTLGANDITVLGAIEDSGGNFYPLRFAGRRTATVEPGGSIIGVATVPLAQGDDFWVRSGVAVTAGQTWQRNGYATYVNGEGTNRSNTVTTANALTSSTSGTIPATQGGSLTAVFRPAAILAFPPTPQACVALIGDSITALTNDNQVDMTGLGFAARAFGNARIPHINLAVSGEGYGSFASGERLRNQLLDACNATHALVGYGANDFNSGATAAQVQANMLAAATLLFGHGIKTAAWTIMPRQDLTAGQVTHRATYNDWLRDGAPIDATTKAAVATGTSSNVLRTDYIVNTGAGQWSSVRTPDPAHPLQIGVFELADIAETSRNSNTFKATYSADGVHPEQVLHTLLRDAIDTSRFTFSSGTTIVPNPMTAAGQMIVGGANGVAQALLPVASRTLKTDGAGVPSWQIDSGGSGSSLSIAKKVGTYVTAYGTKASTGRPNGEMGLYPVELGATSWDFDQILLQVTTAGTASVALFRLVVYASLNGWPDALLVDAGTVAADSTGSKVVSIALSGLTGRIFVGSVCQGNPAGLPQARSQVGSQFVPGVPSVGTDPQGGCGFKLSGVTGAAPASASAAVPQSDGGPVPVLRVAA